MYRITVKQKDFSSQSRTQIKIMERTNEIGAVKPVKLIYVDDKDVEEMAALITDHPFLGKENSRKNSSKKTGKIEDYGHEEVDILMGEVIPEEYIEHTTNKLSKALLNDEEENLFGFQTPKKKQSMTLKAQESASKYATPNKIETPLKSKSGNNDDVLDTPTTTQILRRSKRNSVSFSDKNISPSKGDNFQGTPNKSILKNTRLSVTKSMRTPTKEQLKENEEHTSTPPKQLKRGRSFEGQSMLTPSRRQSIAPSMSTIQEGSHFIPKTPRVLRERYKRDIQMALKHAYKGDDSSESEDNLEDIDSEDDFKPGNQDESSEEELESDGKGSDESDEEGVSSLVNCRKSDRNVEKRDQPCVTPSRRRLIEVNDEFGTDAYFERVAAKDFTSNNTLSRLRNPRIREDSLRDLLKDTDLDHKDPLANLTNDHHALFQRWLFALRNVLLSSTALGIFTLGSTRAVIPQAFLFEPHVSEATELNLTLLREGFNILLYGVGSKRHVLDDFHDTLDDRQVLVVNGFFPGLTIKEILDTLLTSLLREKDAPANPLEAVELIEKIQCRRYAATLYLLIHNLDGPSLKNNKAQTVISKLARIPNVRLIASIDHINAPLMWDQTKLYRYNFSWWDVTTFLPYAVETSFETSLLIQRSGELQLSSLHSVFKSLTKNAKQIYMKIARHQLENASNQAYNGFRFQELYWALREEFLVSTHTALRAQLREFLDHHMVKMKRGGDESLIIPIDNAIIRQFVQSQEEKQES